MALPQRRPTLGPLLLSLLAVAPPAARAWTAGNVVAVTVGDGTVAGAAAGTGSNAANCVAAQLLEFGLAAGGALPLAATGSAAAMPSASAAASFTLLGGAADVGQAAPFSGLPALSSDGLYVTFAGYQAPAGTPVGTSTSSFSITNPGSQSGVSVAVPPASLNRVIGYLDGAGAFATVPGNLNSVLGALPIHSAFYLAQGANSGFFVTGGVSSATVSGGGIFFVPMPSGIGGQMGTPSLVQVVQSGGTASNLKLPGWISQNAGILYETKIASGVSAGVYAFDAVSGAANQSSVPITNSLGYQPRQFAFVANSSGATNLFVADGLSGLLYFPGCAPSLSGSRVCANSVALGVQKIPYPLSSGKTNDTALGVTSIVVGGVPTVVVSFPSGLYLWPTTNTGPFVNATGTCCANPLAGACCWANANAAITPPTNTLFRGLASVPSLPTCTSPGYLCASGTTIVTPCPPGSSCAGGVATPCAAGTWSAGGIISNSCNACPAGTYTASTGTTSLAGCFACALGRYSAAGASTCSLCQPGTYASASGSTACTPCPAGTSSAASGATTAAACAACALNFFASSAGAATCAACPSGGITQATGATFCQLPFTPGNIVAALVGDGSAAGSAIGGIANGTVALQLLEFGANASGALQPTGAGSPLQSASASASLTVLGGSADCGLAAPFSGLPSLSSDGLYLSFVAYGAPAGTPVGVSSNNFPNAANPAIQNSVACAMPPASMSRVIAYFDGAGAVRTVQGDLGALFGNVTVNSAYYLSRGSTSGFYVSGGLDEGPPIVNQGGIFWVPMPLGISGPMGTPSLVQLPNPGSTAGSSSNLKMYTWIGGGAFGQTYASRLASGSAAGVGGVTAYGAANDASAPTSGAGGWGYQPMQFVFVTNSSGATNLYVADGVSGLTYFPSCANASSGFLLCATAAANGARKLPYPPSTGGTVDHALGVTTITIAGALSVVVSFPNGLWVWPVANTGPFNSAAGNCCGTPSGACCWGNSNTAIPPPANLQFRGLAPAPTLPTCTSPGFFCPGGAAAAAPCVAGSACLGGVASPCVPGSYSPGGLAGCAACPAGTFGTSVAATSSAACAACAAGSFSGAGAAACTPCPVGSYASGDGAAACAACGSGLTTVAAGQTSAAACAIPTATPSQTPSPTCTSSVSPVASTSPSPSQSGTPTPSTSPTVSTTSTASFTASVTPSTTASLSPSSTPTPSQTTTPTNTPTPSQTPSVTSVPDVLVAFNISVASSATSLLPTACTLDKTPPSHPPPPPSPNPASFAPRAP